MRCLLAFVLSCSMICEVPTAPFPSSRARAILQADGLGRVALSRGIHRRGQDLKYRYMLVVMSRRWPWVVGFGTTFYLLTRVALTVTDEDVKNSSAGLCVVTRSGAKTHADACSAAELPPVETHAGSPSASP